MAVALPRPARFIAVTTTFLILVALVILLSRRPDSVTRTNGVNPTGLRDEPRLKNVGEPEEPLQRIDGDNYAPGNPTSARRNATMLVLVRNMEQEDILASVRDLERTFNSKFNYPWLFLNDRHFPQSFMTAVRKETRAVVRFETVPWEHWRMPEWINEDLYQETVEGLVEREVAHASELQYHQTCRWNSGLFYEHPALQDIRYYWRVEPGVRFFCDIDYDVFAWMEDHKKTYGFTTSLFGEPQATASLWSETKAFVAEHPQWLHENHAMDWLESRGAETEGLGANAYSTCHFGAAFEIGDMNFWRSEAFRAFFEHLDRVGGFFYERWTDADIHSIGLGLFEDRRNIHWLQDIGYQHKSLMSCPESLKCRGCSTGKMADGGVGSDGAQCVAKWFRDEH